MPGRGGMGGVCVCADPSTQVHKPTREDVMYVGAKCLSQGQSYNGRESSGVTKQLRARASGSEH